MNRRSFVRLLGLAPVAATAAPVGAKPRPRSAAGTPLGRALAEAYEPVRSTPLVFDGVILTVPNLAIGG